MGDQREVGGHQGVAEEIGLHRSFLRKYFSDFFSEDTEHFLCFTTRFDDDERISVEQATNHLFLADFDEGAFVKNSCDGLSRLLKFFLKNDNLEISTMYLNSILKHLCAYYVEGQRWFELEEDGGAEEHPWSQLRIEKNSPLVQFLSYEFGVSFSHMWERLLDLKRANYTYVEGRGKN